MLDRYEPISPVIALLSKQAVERIRALGINVQLPVRADGSMVESVETFQRFKAAKDELVAAEATQVDFLSCTSQASHPRSDLSCKKLCV